MTEYDHAQTMITAMRKAGTMPVPRIDESRRNLPTVETGSGILKGVARGEGLREVATVVLFGGSTYAATAITAMPFSFGALGEWLACAAVAATTGTSLGMRGVDALHRLRGHAPNAGEHAKMAKAVRNAVEARMSGSPDFRQDAERAFELMRSIARLPLENYLEGRTIQSRQGDAFLREMRDSVFKALAPVEHLSPDRSIGTMKMERALRDMLPAYTALINAPIQGKTMDERKATPSIGTRTGNGEACPLRASQGDLTKSQAAGARQASAMAARTANDAATRATVDPWRAMSEDLCSADVEAKAVIVEIDRLRPRIAAVATEYLDVSRRREISTLVDVHLPDMARSYAKALRIATGDDLDHLRARGLQGLLPVLQTLREAHAECVAKATGDLDTKARFMEARHPIVPEELRPIA